MCPNTVHDDRRIPESLITKWQSIVDILAQISGFRAALIMRLTPPEIEVFSSSRSEGNPFTKGDREQLNSGLYCEMVISTRKSLYVPDARLDPLWENNPDLKVDMACYYGIPIYWPDEMPFGTICILNETQMNVSRHSHELIHLFRDTIEAELREFDKSLRVSREMDEERKDAENRYTAIFKQAAVGIARVAPDGQWLEVNDRACEIIGYTQDELCRMTFQQITHPSDLGEDLDLVARVLRGEIDEYSMEKRYIHKDGHTVWALLHVSLVRSSKNKPKYFISVFEDLTEKKNLQKAVEQAQKLEAMGRLVGGIAHEFNNKLAAITGNLFLATRHPERSSLFVVEAEKLCFQASDMVKGLLTYARQESAEKSTTSAGPFIKQTLKRLQVVVPENISVTVEASDDAYWLNANSTQIQQILLNLINNAVDAVAATRNPEIAVVLDAVPVTAAFKRRYPNSAAHRLLKLSLKDNGEGIAESEIDKIFDPFYTTKPLDKGSGLGLAMVGSLVDQHGGTIEVESKVGVGTQFDIYLPLVDPPRAQKPADDAAAIGLGNGQTILVVDDNISVLDVMGEVLVALGYNVIKSQNGKDALHIYQRNPGIGCVLSDVVMPIMGGAELWKQLKMHDDDVKLIFMTGYDQETALRSLKCPILAKPIDTAELSNTLHALLGANTASV